MLLRILYGSLTPLGPVQDTRYWKQGQSTGNKLMPFIGYPRVGMWQFMPPAAIGVPYKIMFSAPWFLKLEDLGDRLALMCLKKCSVSLIFFFLENFRVDFILKHSEYCNFANPVC
uniref:Uncharacterized protein n=1 Tax=Nelumbo nucifera TaxID=4432 RepID=A0A822ZBS8_NELNU|nr:TPA_asm: hypothetical protein HUJ06_015444 [Nelumbo nucifera]